MFRQYLFNWISRLIFRRGYEEHHGQCEDAYAARLGPLHLEINRCFVLNHEDTFVSLCLPLPMQRANSSSWGWGKLFIGYVVCLGEDEIRQPGWFMRRVRPWHRPCPPTPPTTESFPF